MLLIISTVTFVARATGANCRSGDEGDAGCIVEAPRRPRWPVRGHPEGRSDMRANSASGLVEDG